MRLGSPTADKAYLTQLVAANTGVDQATAGKRVDDAIDQVKKTEAELKQKADQARKAASAAAFATAFSMLIGAFIAGAAGALGGRTATTNQCRFPAPPVAPTGTALPVRFSGQTKADCLRSVIRHWPKWDAQSCDY